MTVSVAVDGWELMPEPQRRGIGRFLGGLLPALAAHDGIELWVLQPRGDGDLPVPGTTARPVTRWVPRTRVRAGIVEHVLRLPAELARTPHDVAWSPGTLPPWRCARPWIATLHDLAPLVLDLPGYRFHRAHWRMLGPRLRAANRVVAVSRFAADEGIRELGLDPRRIEVVGHGVESAFRPDGPPSDIAGPYVAAVTTDDPRKGLAELCQVAGRLSAGGVPLHVAGRIGALWRDRLTAAGATVVGHVTDLPAFLRSASVTVVTSRYEGFGFVPLESMACGTPVVVVDTTAVGEVVGDAGVRVAVDDVAGCADAVRALLADDDHARQLAAAGLARAAGFRWETAAARYAEVLRAVASGR